MPDEGLEWLKKHRRTPFTCFKWGRSAYSDEFIVLDWETAGGEERFPTADLGLTEADTEAILACLTDEIIVSVSPQRCPYQAPLNTVQLGPGIAQAGYLNHRRVAQVQSRACR